MGYAPDKVFFFFFLHSSVSNSEVNCQILPEFEFVLDFIPIQAIYKLNKDRMKSKHSRASKFRSE